MVKHFINISDFKKNDLKKIINFAKKIKNNPNKYNKLLSKITSSKISTGWQENKDVKTKNKKIILNNLVMFNLVFN